MYHALDLITIYPDPSTPVPSKAKPAGFVVAEWAYTHVSDMVDALAVRNYLGMWPEGPQFSMLPVDRVAAILNLTTQGVLVNIKAQKIRAVWVGRAWMVPFNEIQAFKPSAQGRPRRQE